jgi:selenoprotein W-related protein
MTPRLEIEYCTRCRWLLRAAWLAQELLTTFETELGEVALIPGSNGVFEVRLDSNTLFSRRREGRFPESKELKQLVRDRIAPHKPLGHSERESLRTGRPVGSHDGSRGYNLRQ